MAWPAVEDALALLQSDPERGLDSSEAAHLIIIIYNPYTTPTSCRPLRPRAHRAIYSCQPSLVLAFVLLAAAVTAALSEGWGCWRDCGCSGGQCHRGLRPGGQDAQCPGCPGRLHDISRAVVLRGGGSRKPWPPASWFPATSCFCRPTTRLRPTCVWPSAAR